MVIGLGNKVHVVYRALYEQSTRRHFIGEVAAAEGGLCRLIGYAFVYDIKSTMYVKKPDLRTTIVDVGDSGYIVNIIDDDVDLSKVEYHYVAGKGLSATDGKNFLLSINEFSVKS